MRANLILIASVSGSGATLQFTLCDMEPAVLSRNIFLFTFLIRKLRDDKKREAGILETLWNAYYHLFVTSNDLEVLKEHASHLCDISDTMETWTASSYGATISFPSAHTLTEMHGLWARYAEPFSVITDAQIRDAITRNHTARSTSLSGMRSVGAHSTGRAAVSTMPAAFKGYWKTGVVAGNDYDVASIQS